MSTARRGLLGNRGMAMRPRLVDAVELLERLPADALSRRSLRRRSVLGTMREVWPLCVRRNSPGSSASTCGHLVDHVLAGGDLLDVRPHELREEDGEVVALAAHAHLGHLADAGELVDHRLLVDGALQGHALGLALDRLQLVVDARQAVVAGADLGVDAGHLAQDVLDLADGGLLRRGEAGAQAVVLGVLLVAQEEVHLLAEQGLLVLQLGDLAPQDGHLALALALLLLGRIDELLAGVLLLLLDLVGRRGPDLPLRDPLQPLVEVVDRLARLVVRHDPRHHVAHLRGEEPGREDAEAQQEALGDDEVLARVARRSRSPAPRTR